MNSNKPFVEIEVKEAMSRHPQSVMVKDTLDHAINLMKENDFTMLPVIDNDRRCIGILSRSDLTETFLNEDQKLSQVLDISRFAESLRSSVDTCQDRMVSEVMTYEVISVPGNEKLTKACRIMASKKIHHLPVVDEDEKLIGVISTYDVVKTVGEA